MKEWLLLLVGGVVVGAFLGAAQPVIQGVGDFHSVPVLTVEFALVGGCMGWMLHNYLRFRRKMLERIARRR